MQIHGCSASTPSEPAPLTRKALGEAAALRMEDRFGSIIALGLDKIALQLGPDVCLRLEEAREAAVANSR